MRKTYWQQIRDAVFGIEPPAPDPDRIKAMMEPPPIVEEPVPLPAMCGTCTFYRPWADAQNRPVCKRNAPTVTVTSAPPDLDGVRPQMYSIMYPSVKAADWCGEYRRA